MAEENEPQAERPINVQEELAAASARFPLVLPDKEIPLDMQMRTIALTIAQRHVGDSTIKEGNLYQQIKMDNKLGGPVTVEMVIHAALVFERYLWGEWSKGIAEHAIEAVSTQAADIMEEEIRKQHEARLKGMEDEDPTRPAAGGPTSE